jgi:hypothetical protein
MPALRSAAACLEQSALWSRYCADAEVSRSALEEQTMARDARVSRGGLEHQRMGSDSSAYADIASRTEPVR